MATRQQYLDALFADDIAAHERDLRIMRRCGLTVAVSLILMTATLCPPVLLLLGLLGRRR